MVGQLGVSSGRFIKQLQNDIDSYYAVLEKLNRDHGKLVKYTQKLNRDHAKPVNTLVP